MRYLILFTLLFIFSSCVSKGREKELLDKISELEVQLDECENGADRLIGKIEKAYSDKRYQEARQYIKDLSEKHPESPKNSEFEKLLIKIEKEEFLEKKKKEAEERERIRLANLNNTGMWSVKYYVDDFGEPTKTGYITNTTYIKGKFSNTATQNSELNVDFLINSSSNISIMLYEYARSNPVKSTASMWDSYQVLIQDKDGKRHELKARNSSDRLKFDKKDSRIIHKSLMKGGTLKFKISEIGRWTTQYNFIIEKADWYENANRKLNES